MGKKITRLECSLTRGGKEHSHYYVVTVPSKNILIHFNIHLNDNDINRFLIKVIGSEEEGSSIFTYYSEEPTRNIDAEHHSKKYSGTCTPKLYNLTHKILTEISKDLKTIILLNPDVKDVQLILDIQF